MCAGPDFTGRGFYEKAPAIMCNKHGLAPILLVLRPYLNDGCEVRVHLYPFRLCITFVCTDVERSQDFRLM